MLMRVRENGDRVLIELTGVAGRQQSVLRALSACREPAQADEGLATAEVTVRSSTNDMRISLRARPGLRVEPTQIYRCLRDALLGPQARPPRSAGTPVAAAGAAVGAAA